MTGSSSDPSLRGSYLLLLAGAVAAAAAFVLFAGIGEYVDPYPRVFLFTLWIVAPFLLLAFNIFFITRFLHPGGRDRIFLRGAILFLGTAALIYGRAFLLPREQVMDRNLMFLLGPFYHFAAAALVTVGYLARSLHLLFNARGRAPSNRPASQPRER